MGSILITGASGGIGRACAERFLGAGWTVGLMARRADKLEEIAAGHENAVVLPGDVGDAAAVVTAFAQFADKAGRLDVLFNNAGIFTPAAPIDEISLDDWHRARSVNLDGMFYCARAAFGQMRRQSPQGGRIINNGSISAHSPREGSATYTTTKHAITGLTKTISLDGRAFDIACGQIDIGNARTELLDGIIEKAKAADEAPPPSMDVGLVADAVMNMATLPGEANVQFMTIMATKMPYIGRG
ncbi:NADP-dependent 3-hydroxy acid dehydrogenase YdfG [Maritimibacter alkaliphilus HTCC2654]|uniref:Oxidoreductase, short chain dehydrogenase/reductase family protein n=1 Tax=Maritimibacter alkaliphilus HTCC2654 TaxID=314271 RepID=A3VE57_9RHOB|nr:SDR family oxidoreductase [Maritimibacter alkaliphilus]EAQ13195.1 oxidoreductase, short chain dehydrogenase/reductase family protein [Rhodobacterales bacterium HTCC2654] [Maritimibacter alkaliphilus HTCC2654]TYP85381.1 NADP-dependent 3-hydroxy acid dehydrogenase YdfG [Maritimibacter alkaliphilus HTCC2654]